MPAAWLNAFWAFGKHDAIGFSPFGIDRCAGADTELARVYDVDFTSRAADSGASRQRHDDSDPAGQRTALRKRSGWATTASKRGYSSRNFGGATNAAPDRVAALFISTGPDDFVIVGRSMNVYFTAATDPSDSVGLASVEEGVYAGGKWIAGRRLNGDETPEWKALRFRGDNYTIQRVKLYRYR